AGVLARSALQQQHVHPRLRAGGVALLRGGPGRTRGDQRHARDSSRNHEALRFLRSNGRGRNGVDSMTGADYQMNAEDFVSRTGDGERVPTGWGELNWKIAGGSMPGAEMTFGTCLIQPGQRNPLHSHPNCEEFLYVVSGACEHRLDDETVALKAGD